MIPFLKGYTAFNATQCDGLPAHLLHQDQDRTPCPLPPLTRFELADRFFEATGAVIRRGGGHAFYAVGPDYVQMPPLESSRDAEAHTACLAHELTHWAKHETRLARIKRGDAGCARNWSPGWDQRSSALTMRSHPKSARTTRPISAHG